MFLAAAAKMPATCSALWVLHWLRRCVGSVLYSSTDHHSKSGCFLWCLHFYIFLWSRDCWS